MAHAQSLFEKSFLSLKATNSIASGTRPTNITSNAFRPRKGHIRCPECDPFPGSEHVTQWYGGACPRLLNLSPAGICLTFQTTSQHWTLYADSPWLITGKLRLNVLQCRICHTAHRGRG